MLSNLLANGQKAVVHQGQTGQLVCVGGEGTTDARSPRLLGLEGPPLGRFTNLLATELNCSWASPSETGSYFKVLRGEMFENRVSKQLSNHVSGPIDG